MAIMYDNSNSYRTEEKQAVSVSGAWCTFRILTLESCCSVCAPQLLEVRMGQDVPFGANSQFYWGSRGLLFSPH